MDIYELLESRPGEVNQSITDFLGAHGTTKAFAENDTIVEEGSPSDAVYIVLEGTANIAKRDAMGNTTIIATAEKGTIFGEMGVLLNLKRSATILAKTPLTALVLSNEKFINALRQYPDMTFRILKSLSGRLNHRNEKIVAMINNKTMIMVGAFILEQCEQQKQSRGEITLDLLKLLKRTGMEPPQAANALANYKRLNIISKFSMPSDDLACFHVNIKVLKSYLSSISIARVI